MLGLRAIAERAPLAARRASGAAARPRRRRPGRRSARRGRRRGRTSGGRRRTESPITIAAAAPGASARGDRGRGCRRARVRHDPLGLRAGHEAAARADLAGVEVAVAEAEEVEAQPLVLGVVVGAGVRRRGDDAAGAAVGHDLGELADVELETRRAGPPARDRSARPATSSSTRCTKWRAAAPRGTLRSTQVPSVSEVRDETL